MKDRDEYLERARTGSSARAKEEAYGFDDMNNEGGVPSEMDADGYYQRDVGAYLSNTEERLDKIDARIAGVEEFMQDALNKTGLRGGELRNRFTVIEDLIRSQRDAAMSQADRNLWDQMPARFGDGDP